MLPPVYGSWQAIYGLFRRWQRAGVRAAIVAALQVRAGAAGLITWDVGVGSTVARAHQHAAGARKKGMFRPNHPVGWATRNRTITVTCDGATPTPATRMFWPRNAANAPGSAARKASAGEDGPWQQRPDHHGCAVIAAEAEPPVT